MQVKANIGGDAYKSAEERAFAQYIRALLPDKFGSEVFGWGYETWTVNMPGNRYTPDFCAILSDGRVIFVEVKGSKSQRGYRDARSKLRAAAALHPEYVWAECIVVLKRGEVASMEIEEIEP